MAWAKNIENSLITKITKGYCQKNNLKNIKNSNISHKWHDLERQKIT